MNAEVSGATFLGAPLAGMVAADDDRIDGRYLEVHQGILSLMARQAPVAGDLRIVAALLHVIRCVERIGDQCVNIAKLVPLSGYEAPKDKDILDAIERMGRLARSQVSQAKRAFAGRNTELAHDLVRQDTEINRLNRAIFRRAVEVGDDLDLREWAMFMILVARCLERIGDNTVDVAEQTVFVGHRPVSRVHRRLAAQLGTTRTPDPTTPGPGRPTEIRRTSGTGPRAARRKAGNQVRSGRAPPGETESQPDTGQPSSPPVHSL
jgi:phosphate transport system protein